MPYRMPSIYPGGYPFILKIKRPGKKSPVWLSASSASTTIWCLNFEKKLLWPNHQFQVCEPLARSLSMRLALSINEGEGSMRHSILWSGMVIILQRLRSSEEIEKSYTLIEKRKTTLCQRIFGTSSSLYFIIQP